MSEMVSKQHPLGFDFTLGKRSQSARRCQIWQVRGVVKNGNAFLRKKSAATRHPVLQSMHVVIACTKFFFFKDLQRQSYRQYPCWCQAHPLSFEVTGDNFAATAAEPFWCCLLFFSGVILNIFPTSMKPSIPAKNVGWRYCFISLGCTQHFNSFCCSFTGFKTKLYSLTTWLPPWKYAFTAHLETKTYLRTALLTLT